MLAIIISACLTSNPTVCKDYRIPVDADLDTTQCALSAPPHFAKWAESHPEWQIKRWQCTTKSVTDL